MPSSGLGLPWAVISSDPTMLSLKTLRVSVVPLAGPGTL